MMLPMTVQFAHIFEAHEHISCQEKSTHIHKKVTECKICDFHFFPITYDFSGYSEYVKATISSIVVLSFTALFINSFTNNTTLLRGPPNFLA